MKVHYTGSLGSGQHFDSSEGREPIAFEIGKGEVIPGFEEAIVGMEPGDTKTVTIPASEAYGARREELVFSVPRTQVPAEVELAEGMRVSGTTQQGQRVDMTVVSFNEETVTLDANHPLAGEALTFEIELVEIA